MRPTKSTPLSVIVCLALIFSLLLPSAAFAEDEPTIPSVDLTPDTEVHTYANSERSGISFKGPDGLDVYWKGIYVGKTKNGIAERNLEPTEKYDSNKGCYVVDENNNYYTLFVVNGRSFLSIDSTGAVYNTKMIAKEKPSCDLSDLSIDMPAQKYGGSPVTIGQFITISQEIDGIEFIYKEGIDYVISYSNNNRPGEAIATVKPAEGSVCTGLLEIPFKIKDNTTVTVIDNVEKIDLGTLSGKWLKDRIYTGKEIRPNLALYGSDAETLKLGSDYTVTYKKNIKPGVATMTVTGIGNKCTGTKIFFFRIKKIPAKQVIKIKKKKLQAKKDKFAAGYQFQVAKKANMKKAKNYFSRSNIKKVKVKKRFVRCRAYQIINGQKVFGKWSNIKRTK